MPAPHRRADFGDAPRLTINGFYGLQVSLAPRTLNAAERQARYRAGHRAPGGKGAPDLVWSETRNGLPWKPYRYRGQDREAS